MVDDRAAPRRFPPYAYVPGHRPHPTRHPSGHSHGRAEATPAPMDPAAWQQCAPYLDGLALFDRGYYWEAHEAWEGLWVAAGRHGAVAELLGGLIKLAAAGVKVRQGRGEAAARLAARARACLERAQQSSGTSRLAGLAFDDLIAFAEHVVRDAAGMKASPELAVEVVFARALSPDGLEKSTG
jgi:uncharacterized protein